VDRISDPNWIFANVCQLCCDVGCGANPEKIVVASHAGSTTSNLTHIYTNAVINNKSCAIMTVVNGLDDVHARPIDAKSASHGVSRLLAPQKNTHYSVAIERDYLTAIVPDQSRRAVQVGFVYFGTPLPRQLANHFRRPFKIGVEERCRLKSFDGVVKRNIGCRGYNATVFNAPFLANDSPIGIFDQFGRSDHAQILNVEEA
jgi:hypothetical protein